MTTQPSALTVPEGPILEGMGLVKRFGGGGWLSRSTPVHAINGVSLSINAGETFAIVGESGCGKSTLGRLLLRLMEPTEGAVHYRGKVLGDLPPQEMRALRRELQIIFQDPFASLNPRMSVGDIIGEPLWLHGLAQGRADRRDRVAALLRTVGLPPEYADRFPHEFSGGQRQRIGVARALAGEPRLIIGDEPVSALDVSIQAQIINLLEELKETFGLTLVIVAHDLAVIRHMSDRVAVMYLGEIVELAPVDALFETPLHPYSQALLEAIPSPSLRGRRPRALLQGELPSPTALPTGCRFHTRCPHARPRCSETRPALQMAADGHQVACHFWRELQSSGASAPATAATTAMATSPNLTRRLHLYRSHQNGGEQQGP